MKRFTVHYAITESEGFGDTRVFRVRPVGSPEWQGTDVWYVPRDRRANCCQCSSAAVAMLTSCAHAKAVKRYVAHLARKARPVEK